MSTIRTAPIRGFSLLEIAISTTIFVGVSTSLMSAYFSTVRVEASQLNQMNSMTAANVALRETLMASGRDLPAESGIATLDLNFIGDSCGATGSGEASGDGANSLSYECTEAKGLKKVHMTVSPEIDTSSFQLAEICILVEYVGGESGSAFFPAGAATSFTDNSDVCALTGAFKRYKRL